MFKKLAERIDLIIIARVREPVEFMPEGRQPICGLGEVLSVECEPVSEIRETAGLRLRSTRAIREGRRFLVL